MAITDDVTTTETEVTTNPEVETPEVETPEADKPEAGNEAEKPEVEAASEDQPPAYTPNFKFKVQKNEYEIDPIFQSVIKDADTEKKVKELYQKAYGLDIVKAAYDRDNQEFKTLKAESDYIRGQLAEIKDDYDRGNMDGVFSKLGIPKEKILQWLVNEAQYRELPKEQRDILDSKRLAEEKAYSLEKRQADFQRNYESLQTQVKRMELERVLEKPDVKSFADQFDAKAGTPGAFWNAVAEHGEMVSLTRKIDLTADQAVKEVMAKYGMFYSPTPSQQTQGAVTQVQTKQKPPVIPNVAGKNQSPVDRSPKSIADLKKLAASMDA